MATKIARIKWDSPNTILPHTSSMLTNSLITTINVNSSQYSNGDKIEVRLVGAKHILSYLIQNANTGAIINAEAVGDYSVGTNESTFGKYIRTGAIASAVDLNILILWSIENISNVVLAQLN